MEFQCYPIRSYCRGGYFIWINSIWSYSKCNNSKWNNSKWNDSNDSMLLHWELLHLKLFHLELFHSKPFLWNLLPVLTISNFIMTVPVFLFPLCLLFVIAKRRENFSLQTFLPIKQSKSLDSFFLRLGRTEINYIFFPIMQFSDDFFKHINCFEESVCILGAIRIIRDIQGGWGVNKV